MPELEAVKVIGADGWVRFEEAPNDESTQAWIAAGPDSHVDREANR